MAGIARTRSDFRMIDHDRLCLKCYGIGTVVPKHSKHSVMECVSCGGTGIVHRIICGREDMKEIFRKVGRRVGPQNAWRAFEGHQGFVTADEAKRRRVSARARLTGEHS